MFQELMPLLKQRTLLITLSQVGDEQICVNVIPKIAKAEHNENQAALTTPLSVTGTAKELDEGLAQQLTEFAEAHIQLSSTLKSAKEEIDAAAKAARESAKKPAKTNVPKGNKAAETSTKTETADEDQPAAEEKTAASQPVDASTTTGNLFDPPEQNSQAADSDKVKE